MYLRYIIVNHEVAGYTVETSNSKICDIAMAGQSGRKRRTGDALSENFLRRRLQLGYASMNTSVCPDWLALHPVLLIRQKPK